MRASLLFSLLILFTFPAQASSENACAEVFKGEIRDCGFLIRTDAMQVHLHDMSLKNFRMEINVAMDFKLKNVDLSQASFRGMKFLNSSFENTQLEGTTFYGVRFEDVDFSKSDVSKARFVNCYFRNVKFAAGVASQAFINPIFAGKKPF